MDRAWDGRMLAGVFNQPNYLLAQRQMDWALAQQVANAVNLANQNVPGYKRVEAQKGFKTALDNLIKKGDD